jgi:hypothetical protein
VPDDVAVKGGMYQLNVQVIEKGTDIDLAALQKLGAPTNGTPYFLRYTLTNLNSGGPFQGGVSASILGVLSDGRMEHNLNLGQDFARCEVVNEANMPEGKPLSGCVTYIVPSGTELVGAQWSPLFPDSYSNPNGVYWTK